VRKLTIIVLSMILVLAIAAVAKAWTNVTYGIYCKTDASSESVLCMRDNGTGYGIGISKYGVTVMRNGAVVFQRYQP